jgi:hypothetical protein
MRLWLFSCTAAIAIVGCVSQAQPKPSTDESLVRYWREQSACVAAWEDLLDEWEHNGGGLKATLRETREQLATDHTSRFAALIRTAWAAQGNAVTANGALERLPPEISRPAILAMTEAAQGVVPSGCEPPIYLENWWNRRLLAHRPSDMPTLVSNDLWEQRTWLQGWLFVRTQ